MYIFKLCLVFKVDCKDFKNFVFVKNVFFVYVFVEDDENDEGSIDMSLVFKYFVVVFEYIEFVFKVFCGDDLFIVIFVDDVGFEEVVKDWDIDDELFVFIIGVLDEGCVVEFE